MEHFYSNTRRIVSPPFIAAALMLIATIAGCRDDGIGNRTDDGRGIQVEAARSSVILRNNTLETVYYMAVERETAKVIDWFPRFSNANAVKYGEPVVIPYTNVTGYRPQCEILIYMWNGMQASPVLVREGSMRSLIIQTP